MKTNRIVAGIMSVSLTFAYTGMNNLPVQSFFSPISVKAVDIVDSGELSDSISWIIDSEGTLTISGSGEMTWFVFRGRSPWFYSSMENVKKVEIEDGITSICDYAFDSFTNLVSIQIPDSVVQIGMNAFSNCPNLSDMFIPSSVSSIGSNAFENCLWLENKKKEDPMVVINGILIEGKKCSGDIVIPDTVTTISKNAFLGAQDLISVIIPDSVTTIGCAAFAGCPNLESVTIPESISTIESDLFRSCPKLEKVIIPDSVNHINGTAFWDTKWLDEKRKDNPLVVINSIIIDGRTCSGDLVIPNGIIGITNNSFVESDISSIIIPDTVRYIGEGAFAGSEQLETVKLPDSLTELGSCSFYECSALKTIVIPKSIETIKEQTFWGCIHLETVYFPDSVNRIDNNFAGCPKYAVLTIANPECEIFNVNDVIIKGYKGSTAEAYAQKYGNKFIDIEHDEVEIIENGRCGNDLTYTLDNYGTLTISGTGEMGYWETDTEKFYWDPYGSPWNKHIKDIYKVIIEEGATNVFPTAFTNTSNLYSVSLPETIESIGSEAFKNCRSLIDINIPKSVKEIWKNAFYETAWLSAKKRDSVSVIENGLLFDANYNNCGSRLSIPDSVSRICSGAFYECKSIEYVSVPSSVMEIKGSAFSTCSNLKSISILNPNCIIHDSSSTICNGLDENYDGIYTGVIKGYKGSTAEEYAKKYNITFIDIESEPDIMLGDPNEDGKIDAKDASIILVYYSQMSTGGVGSFSDEQRSASNVNGDDKVDAKDASCILSYYAYISTGGEMTIERFLSQ